jgi:voltage-gated sodium channel
MQPDYQSQNLPQRLVNLPWFKGTVFGAILAGAVLVGLETIPWVHEGIGATLWQLDRLILAIFIAEIVLKIAACGSRPWRYFTDPWNLFDFAVTAVCLLPIHAQYAQVLRLGRVARSLRLITALPQLQVIVTALLKSLPSFGWITLLLLTLLYVYSVMAVFLFGENDPQRFGALWNSFLTMFGVLTLEGWQDVMQDQMLGLPGPDGTAHPGMPIVAPLFFVSFIMTGTMIFLNLLVGVIVNSMSEMPLSGEVDDSLLPSLHAPHQEGEHAPLIAERLAHIETVLSQLTTELAHLRGALAGSAMQAPSAANDTAHAQAGPQNS